MPTSLAPRRSPDAGTSDGGPAGLADSLAPTMAGASTGTSAVHPPPAATNSITTSAPRRTR